MSGTPLRPLDRPRRLVAGDTVALVATSGPVVPDRVARGVALLESWGLAVRVGDHVLRPGPGLPLPGRHRRRPGCGPAGRLVRPGRGGGVRGTRRRRGGAAGRPDGLGRDEGGRPEAARRFQRRHRARRGGGDQAGAGLTVRPDAGHPVARRCAAGCRDRRAPAQDAVRAGGCSGGVRRGCAVRRARAGTWRPRRRHALLAAHVHRHAWNIGRRTAASSCWRTSRRSPSGWTTS